MNASLQCGVEPALIQLKDAPQGARGSFYHVRFLVLHACIGSFVDHHRLGKPMCLPIENFHPLKPVTRVGPQ